MTLRKLRRRLVATVVLLTSLLPCPLLACPFCPALVPTLCQQREAATVVLLAEIVAGPSDVTTARVHRVLKGESGFTAGLTLPLPKDLTTPTRGLVLLFGSPRSNSSPAGATDLDWQLQPVDETSYAYFGRAPGLRTPAAERLRYFAPFLEHADTGVAADAAMEFAHAPFDQVAAAADALPMAAVRRWIVDARVPQERKGFYGLVLGLATKPHDVAANRELLRHEIDAPRDDLRSGFDGLLAGYLLLEGEPGLELLEERFLANPTSRDGDVRHTLAALRFYAEYGQEIPLARIAAAVEPLLGRPEFASAVIVELARWQDWAAIGQIVPLYDAPGYPQPGTRRAVVGYLLAAPGAEADTALTRLREKHPEEVAEAEQHLSLFGGAR